MWTFLDALQTRAALGAVGLAALIAQATPIDGAAQQWIERGALGLVILGACAGWIHFKPEVDELKADKARLQAQVDELMAIQREQALPALSSSARALSGTANQAGQVADLAASIDQIDQLMQELIRRES